AFAPKREGAMRRRHAMAARPRRDLSPLALPATLALALVASPTPGAARACLGGEPAGRGLLDAPCPAGDTEIFLVDPETGDARNLTRSPKSGERYPSWSPDGTRIAFNSDRDGTYNLYIADADGSNPRPLTREKAPVVAGMQ